VSLRLITPPLSLSASTIPSCYSNLLVIIAEFMAKLITVEAVIAAELFIHTLHSSSELHQGRCQSYGGHRPAERIFYQSFQTHFVYFYCLQSSSLSSKMH